VLETLNDVDPKIHKKQWLVRMVIGDESSILWRFKLDIMACFRSSKPLKRFKLELDKLFTVVSGPQILHLPC
jgi:hypothetical protein